MDNFSGIGKAAADLIEDKMIVGLGTGRAAASFIEALIKRCKKGLDIKAVASSGESGALARAGGIKVLDLNEVERVDITVDGADEIDPQKRMIKGGGGALLREKILAGASRELVIAVGSEKLVSALGRYNLPVEVVSYGSGVTKKQLEKLGYKTSWRLTQDNYFYVTENGHLILDIIFDKTLDNPEEIHERFIRIPGVVDTGFFFGLAGRVVVGYPDGRVEIKKNFESIKDGL